MSASPRLRAGLVRIFATTVAVIGFGGSRLLACPMCWGAEETSMIDGTKLGILVMLGITFSVQAGFVGFFLYLRKRARRIAEADLETEWSDLQRSKPAAGLGPRWAAGPLEHHD
jgi:hypothetical protein